MSDPAQFLAKKHFGVASGELLAGGMPISSLAEKYGTPSFVYDRKVIDAKLDALRGALPPIFEISYSVKANPNLAVLKHFVAQGCGLEIASAGEFHLGMQAGCRPQRMLFAGPGKTDAELHLVVSHGIGEIHIESLLEAKRLGTICRKLGVRASVAIRVNPAGEAEGGAMRMGGRPAPFGIDEEILDEAVDAVLADNAIELSGIHVFLGTQILDANILIAQYRHGLEVARRVAKRSKRPLRRVDLGGGLGIPYFANEKELDLVQVHDGLSGIFAEIETEEAFRGTQFLVEPGRFLVGESGIYFARVNDIKVSRGKKFLIVDGGMNHHLAASGNLGQTIKRNYPVGLLNKMEAPAEEVVDVVGPLCTPLDTLARSVNLPHAEVGDLFGIFQSGAYGRSASPLGFLSHPAPAEIWVDAGRDSLICARGEFPDSVHDQSLELKMMT